MSERMNRIDLRANNFELTRAALTAADQVYGKTEVGFKLQPIDNSGAGRSQPWKTPAGWVIKSSLEDLNFGGKIVLYANAQTKQIMVVPMGTNGNADVRGWYSNFKDYGLSQWRAIKPDENGESIKDKVFKEINGLLREGYQGVVLPGDSKGGAQVQFIVHDIIEDRNNKKLEKQGLTYLAALQNHQIGIVAHNAPGVEAVLRSKNPNFDPQSPEYDGIQTLYIVSKMQKNDMQELVSQTGGRYLANDGWVYQNALGVGIHQEQVKKNANAHVYLHRLSQSLYDGIGARGGDFSELPQVPRTLMSVNELAAFGGALASIGEGESVSTLEAKARIGSAAICAGVTAPFSASIGALKGEFGLQTVAGLGSLAVWAAGGGAIMAGLCGISIAGSNGAKYVGGKDKSLVVSNADLQAAINTVDAPSMPPEDSVRVFGLTDTGGMYVFDVSKYGLGGELYCHEEGIRSTASIKNRAVDLSYFDSKTGKAIGHGSFSCQHDGHLTLTQAQFASATVAGQIQQLVITSSDDIVTPPVIKQVHFHQDLLSAAISGDKDGYATIFERHVSAPIPPDLAGHDIVELGVTQAFDIDNSRAPRIDVNPHPEFSQKMETEGSEVERVRAGYIEKTAAYSVQYGVDFLFDTRFTATQQASMASGGVRPGALQLDLNPRPNDFLEKNFQFGSHAAIFTTETYSSVLDAAALGSLAFGSLQQAYIDPILLDLTGQGVHMTDYTHSGVLFDMDHSGTLRRTGWMDIKTGMLIDDRGRGQVNDISQVFSEYYDSPAGRDGLPAKKRFSDSYEALRSVDSNKNGVIEPQDTIWSRLKVWVDANHNGESEASELKSLDAYGISQINLATRPAMLDEMREGNRVRAYGSFIMKRRKYEALSVDFIADPTRTTLRLMGQSTIVTSQASPTIRSGFGAQHIKLSAPAAIKTYASHKAHGETLDADALGVNHLYGGRGNDKLIASRQGSWLVGGGGSNIYQGGPGDDVLIISATDKLANIQGGGGTNTAIIVGKGDVLLNMQAAQIHIAQGGPGNTILVSGGGTAVYIKGGSGTNTLVGGAGDDVLVGGSGHNFIVGGTGKSIIYAGPKGDVIYGAQGDSIIHAGGGEDYIIAGPGNDVIEVGCGNAYIDGGAGINMVQFHGSYGDYRTDKTAQGYIVTDKMPQRDGKVTLLNIHRFGFSDISIVDFTTLISPLPVADSLRVNQNGQVFDRIQTHTIKAEQLLGNDQLFNGQVPLKVIEVSEAVGGAVSLSPTGDILFTPNSQLEGMMQFTYTIADANGQLAGIYHSLATDEKATLRAVVSLLTPEIPFDPLITQQWYLNDANILITWQDYTGKGIRIAQFEPSGPFAVGPEILNYQHPDLRENVDSTWLAAERAKGTLPTAFSNHATLVAGVMVAAKNGIGMIGVAPDAKIRGYSIDIHHQWAELSALSHMAGADVINHSWGMSPDFLMNSSPEDALNIKHMHMSAVNYAANHGRGGLGSVMVCATSNGRAQGESSQGSAMNNNRFSIQVGTINAAGDLSTLQIAQEAFSSPGASILVSAPGSNIVSTSQMVMTERGSIFGKEISEQQGTSFAAPIVSGIVALLLEANRHLGYRDVQHILQLSARKVHQASDSWADNHARYWNNGAMHTSHDYGFGAVDTRAAVRLAETWLSKKTGANLFSYSEKINTPAIQQNGKIISTVTIPPGLQIEHIDVDLDLSFSNLGDVIVKLISPLNTESLLLNRHGVNPADFIKAIPAKAGQARPGRIKHRFMTTHDWGESSQGDWTLEISSVAKQLTTNLHSWALHFYGSLPIVDDIYFYTDEYPDIAKANPQRAILDDAINGSAGGRNTLQAAAVRGEAMVNLLTGNASISGQGLTIQRPHEIHNIITGDGNDVLVATHSGAMIDGGRGQNILTGGLGEDVFVIHRRPHGRDILINFAGDNQDKIYLVGFPDLSSELTLTIEGLDVHLHLQNEQRVILQNYAPHVDKVKQNLVIQDTLTIPGWYIDSHSEVKYAEKDSGVIMLSGGYQGVAVGGASDSLAGFNWALAGKLYDHDQAKMNKFVVNSLNNSTPYINTDKLDYGNTIRGFKPDNDHIDLGIVGIKSFDDLIIQRKEYGKFGTVDVVVIQGTEVLSRSLGDERGPAVLAYLDAIDPYQITASHFVFAENPLGSVEKANVEPTSLTQLPTALSLPEGTTEFTPIRQSQVYRDWHGTGTYQHMAWTGNNQSFLAYDKNQDGMITDWDEINFAEYLPGAQTDLEGLVAFDSNQDGKLDKQDAAWSQFGWWYDQNMNGHCEEGEFRSLEDWQIESISLQSDHVMTYLEDVTVLGKGHYVRQDGSTGRLFDTALHFEEVDTQEWERHIASLTNNLITLQATASANDGSMVFEDKFYCGYIPYFSWGCSEKQGLDA